MLKKWKNSLEKCIYLSTVYAIYLNYWSRNQTYSNSLRMVLINNYRPYFENKSPPILRRFCGNFHSEKIIGKYEWKTKCFNIWVGCDCLTINSTSYYFLFIRNLKKEGPFNFFTLEFGVSDENAILFLLVYNTIYMI